jgi:hypothetical protein
MFCEISNATAATVKMAVFWDVVIEIRKHFEGNYCLHHLPDEGGSKNL